MFGKSALFCDRRVYCYKGFWKNPLDDYKKPFFYFVSTPRTMESRYTNGREELVETMEITVFGCKPFALYDTIYLQDGSEFKITNIVLNELEPNILVRDMLKPRVESQVLTLE